MLCVCLQIDALQVCNLLCVQSEIPVLKWPAGIEFGHKENWSRCLKEVIKSPIATQTSRCLFPRCLAHCDTADVDNARTHLQESLSMNSDEIAAEFGTEFDEVVRIFLVLQHNGFESGLYRYLTVVNHSCQPNCIKYAPTSSSFGASEIWTTEPIEAGQELLICYVEPQGQSPLHVREYLHKNHTFACNCRRCAYSFSCSVSSIDVNLVYKFNEWQSKIEKLEQRYPYFQKLVSACLNRLQSIPRSGNPAQNTSFAASVQEFLGLSARMKTYVFRVLSIREDLRSSRTMIHPEITKFMYRRLMDSLRNFLDLYLDLTMNYYLHVAGVIDDKSSTNAALFNETLDNIVRALGLSLECGLDDISVVMNCCGDAHPLTASALIDLSSTMDKLMTLCKSSAANQLFTTASNRSSSRDSSSDKPVSLFEHIVAQTQQASNVPAAWMTSVSSFQKQHQHIHELGEAIRKLYVTARHYPESIQLMSRGKPGAVFWGNHIHTTQASPAVGLTTSAPTLENVFAFAAGGDVVAWTAQGTDVEMMTIAEWTDSLRMFTDEEEAHNEIDDNDSDEL
jgi:hypothetical protein